MINEWRENEEYSNIIEDDALRCKMFHNRNF